MSREEELEVIAKAQKGDKAARDRLVLQYMPLVHGVAYRANRRRDEDLAQEGVFGLIRAIDRFDASKGCRFVTYAKPWVMAFVGAAKQKAWDVRAHWASTDSGEILNDGAERTCHSSSTNSLIDWVPTVDRAADDNPEHALSDAQRDASVRSAVAKIRTAVGKLGQAVLDHRLMSESPMTLADLGALMGVSREAIRQAEIRVTAALKRYLPTQVEDVARFG